MRYSLLLSGLAAVLVAGCAGETELLPSPVDLNETSEADLVPEMPAADEGIRARRRMDAEQLSASMRIISGGIGWTELNGDGEEIDLFEELGATLGVPDYIQRTREDLTASVVFEKFLGDASRAVCSGMVGRELTQGAAEAVLMLHAGQEDSWETNAQGVERNMRYLLLRFHGTGYGAGDPRLDPWLWLFRSSMQDGSAPALAWHTVCVSLFTHPDFYSY